MAGKPSKLLLCYGSLKSGFHNNWRLGQKARFWGFCPIQGVMYLHHNYPKLYKIDTTSLVPSDPLHKSKSRNHIAEVWQVDDTAYNEIAQMEIDAGYVIEKIDTNWGSATVFWMPKEHFDGTDKHIPAYTYDVLPEEIRDYLKRNAEPPIKQ